MNRNPQQPPNRLRAIIEIDSEGGEPTICPVGDSDLDRKLILDALRIFLDEHTKK
jgi:hypothetical protein